MTLFCPDGYVPVQEAIDRAVLHWFPEQIAAIMTAVADELASNDRPEDNNNALTGVEKLARAFVQPSISQGLRQQREDVRTRAEHRLRNLLHQGVLTAYYFGGLFDQGRHAVACEFWAAPKAERVLLSGSYWPFGKAQTWHEPRPNYPLFFLESDLAALLSDEPTPPVPRTDGDNDTGDKARQASIATAGQEAAAIKALASHLRTNANSTRADAAEWCRKSGYKLGKRAFERVWPQARETAGLGRIGSPGRKRKSTR